MKVVPRRLIVLGGGAAGVEIAQIVRSFGGEVALVEVGEHLLGREPAPLGEALGEALRRDGIELVLGVRATGARRDGDEYVLVLEDGSELRGDRLLVATGRRPRAGGLGLEEIGVEVTQHGIKVDAYLRAAERLWAIGDVNGLWLLTHVGEYQGEVVASNILGEAEWPTTRRYRASSTQTRRRRRLVRPRPASAPRPLAEASRTPTYTHAYAESNGFLTLLSDGTRLTGAYALGPEAGEWLQQVTLAIRARVPLEVLNDTIQPFPSFSGIFATALKQLRRQVASAHEPIEQQPEGAARS